MFYKNIWAKKQSNSSTTYILESEGGSNWLEKHEKSKTSGKKKDG
jgi:hypothetical protein